MPQNVLMIVADTVRDDYLGVHGGHVRTPHLDELARSSVDFRRYYACSFPTVPARADYLTGTYAFTDIGWGPLPRDVTTVPEQLVAAGITTAAVVDTPFFRIKGYNYDRGFWFFYDMESQDVGQLNPDPRVVAGGRLVPVPRATEFDHCAPQTMTLAEQCLEQLVDRQPFLLYVDTWDPHEPWDAPDWYVRPYKGDYDGRQVYPTYGNYREAGLTEDDLATARACYSGKLTMVDRWIGRLLDRLETLGLGDDTAVLFTSDHGFYFGERGGQLGKVVAGQSERGERRWRRSPLYDELVQVPLFLKAPGIAPRESERLVSAIDVAPTLLDLFGVEPMDTVLGRSVLPLGRSPEAEGDALAVSALPLATPGTASLSVVDDVSRNVLEWQPITVTTKRWSMLFATWSEPIELYDLTIDPEQQHNVVNDHPKVVKELHGMMIAELERAGADSHAIRARS